MATTLASSTVAHARSLIRAGKVNRSSAWSFGADDGNAILGKDGEDWSAYGLVHLGRDYSASVSTKDEYKYPIIKNGKVYLAGLRAAISRAAQQHDTSIETAARGLLHLAEDKSAVKDSVWFDEKSSHGWRVGQRAEYPYRFWGSDGHPMASGTVTAVTSTGVRLRPDPAFAYGEGTVHRTFDKVHHTSRKKATGKPGSYPH